MGILIAFIVLGFSCLLIWRACNGFAVASEYIGRNLSEGVRGGTINAISSSLPELFTTLIALFILKDQDGFAIGMGTTAGSALFNGMIIPALIIITVVGAQISGKRKDGVNISRKVVLRDGLSVIFVTLCLLLIMMGDKLVWWQGLALMVFYGGYLTYMITSMNKAAARRSPEEKAPSGADIVLRHANDHPTERMRFGHLIHVVTLGNVLDLEQLFVKDKQREQIKKGTWNGWPLLITAALLIAVASFLLVKACEWLGTGPGNALHQSFHLFGNEFHGIGMPTLFVAVIFASMATSVPDTIISILDAKEGGDDDAVANAIGSNVFDICFALGFPLFLYTLLFSPIELHPETAQQSRELVFLLLVLTICGFVTFLLGPRATGPHGGRRVRLGKRNAFLLLVLYGGFLVYILGRSFDAPWTRAIAGWINDFTTKVAGWLPGVTG